MFPVRGFIFRNKVVHTDKYGINCVHANGINILVDGRVFSVQSCRWKIVFGTVL